MFEKAKVLRFLCVCVLKVCTTKPAIDFVNFLVNVLNVLFFLLVTEEDNPESDNVVTNDDDDNLSPRKLPAAKLPTQKKKQNSTLSVSSVGSCNSSMSSRSSDSSSESDVMSADSELENNRELLKQEYRKYLEDPKDTRVTNAALSHSF